MSTQHEDQGTPSDFWEQAADLSDQDVDRIILAAEDRCRDLHPERWRTVTEQRVSCLRCKDWAVRSLRAQGRLAPLPDQGTPRGDAYIDIVFDGPPSHMSGRFVEVENAAGVSVNAGEWIMPDGDVCNRDTPAEQLRSQDPSGLWRLRIPLASPVTDQGTHVVVTNAPPWMTPQEVAERLKMRGKPMPRVTVDGVTREPDGPGVNLFLPSLNDPRGRREDAR